MNYEEANSVKELALKVDRVLEELGWKWQPKVGEWWRLNDYVWLIKDDSDIEYCQSFPPPNIVAPILHWEEIERVLEKAEIVFCLEDREWLKEEVRFKVTLDDTDISNSVLAESSTRQEAVMKAVNKLRKEIK